MPGLDLEWIVLNLPVILLSLTIHEFSHAYVAVRMGDPTPRWTGRLTLNPLAHLDLVGTLALVLTRSFGWAKPVEINPGNFRDRRAGTIMVSLAGPGSNLIFAIVLSVIYKILVAMAGSRHAISLWAIRVCWYGVAINLGLAVFNLVPIPPLDGSKILGSLLHGRAAYEYYKLERYSYIILLAFIITPLSERILSPIIGFLYRMIM